MSDASLAEVCVVACAEAWRGDGEILAMRTFGGTVVDLREDRFGDLEPMLEKVADARASTPEKIDAITDFEWDVAPLPVSSSQISPP